MRKRTVLALAAVVLGVGVLIGALWQQGHNRHPLDAHQTIIIRVDSSLPDPAQGIVEQNGVCIFTFRDAGVAREASADAYWAAAARYATAMGLPVPSRSRAAAISSAKRFDASVGISPADPGGRIQNASSEFVCALAENAVRERFPPGHQSAG
jgi:hypothetical protein